MQKLKSSLTNMVLVLVGVSLIIGGLLAYINHLTEGPIAEKAEKTLAVGIKNVMGTNDLQVAEPVNVTETIDGKPVSFTIHATTDKSGKNLGAAVESVTGGFGGDLKVLVDWFQKGGKGNIIGKNPADGDLHVSKDDKTGNAVDAITASTITSRAFLKAINQAYAVYIKSNKKR